MPDGNAGPGFSAREFSQASEHDHKRPLFRPLPPSPYFPVEALGALRDAAEAINLISQAPLAMCAQSVVAAATLAVQAHYDVEQPGAGRRPLTGLFLTIAESGERKTSVDRLALKAVHAAEARLVAEAAGQMKAFKIDYDAWKAVREKAKSANKADRASMVRALESAGDEPRPPPSGFLLIADLTPEGLIVHLDQARSWGGVFTSEGGVLFGGAGFTDESRMRTGALLNILWDGEAIRRMRSGTGPCFLRGRRCSAHVMVQPVAATRLLGDAELDGIGLLARFLIVAPDGTAGSRMFREPPIGARQVLAEYDDRLAALLDRQTNFQFDDDRALRTELLHIHPGARKMWIAFHDEVERAQLPEAELASVRPFASKMAEHACRLGAVLTVYADPEALEVTPTAMEGGIMLARHYAAELLRVRGGATVDPDLMLAQRLVEWWQARTNPRCPLAVMYQCGPNPLRDATTARRIVAILEDHGWVRPLKLGTVIDGKPRREAWELIP